RDASRHAASRLRGAVSAHCGELNDRFQSSFHLSRTPLICVPRNSALDDQISGIAGASITSILSMFAYAWRRAAGSVICVALSIASLICGLSSWAQLELLIGTIALSLNGMYR